jgi:hypothetical protein
VTAPKINFSVFDTKSKTYDVYEGPYDGRIHAGTPPTRKTMALGATVEQAAWPLPFGSKKVGTSVKPVGKVASLGDTTTTTGGFHWYYLVGVAAVAYYFTSKASKR